MKVNAKNIVMVLPIILLAVGLLADWYKKRQAATQLANELAATVETPSTDKVAV
jgi:hypothetical protein